MTTLADAAGLASVYADRLLVGTTRDVHQAVSRRVLRLTGQRRGPVGWMHESITGTVYGTLSLATRALGHVPARPVLAADLEATRAGRRTRSIVNGLIGDVLLDRQDPVAILPAVRVDGRDVALEPDALQHAYPTATGRVAVFVHGLCEDDESWGFKAAKRGPSYLQRMTAAGRWTPVAVRYNSGAPVRDNARVLVAMLDQLLDAWPVTVDEVALVGHSMGGLLARAGAAEAEELWWAPRVRHVVLLGSPHAGAPLERFVKRAVPALRRVPELAPVARILDERSAGIRDLHDGIGADLVAWPQAAYHCAGASLGATETSLTGRLLGDLLVDIESARGTAAELEADFRRLTGAHHFDLLNHPSLWEDLERWLDGQADAETPSDGHHPAEPSTHECVDLPELA